MRRLLPVAIAAVSLAFPAAAAARLSGKTTLSLALGTQRALVDQGVAIRAVEPATTNGISFVFPRSGRRWRGAIELRRGRHRLLLRLPDPAVAHSSRHGLRLTRLGARLVDHVAGAHVVHRGARLGDVFSQVCRRPPCGRTRLGSFTPFITGAVGFDDMVTEARALGVSTLRFSQTLGAPTRPAFSLFEREGIAAVPTVHVAQPLTTPQSVATFRSQLGALLDSVPRPAVLMVENEEIAPRFFSGTMAQYAQELAAAVDVAHARGIKVTNGGITDAPVKLLTWKDYVDRGLTELADQFAARAFAGQPAVVRALQARPFTGLPNATLQGGLDRAIELIRNFRHSAMDYVDFHFYTDDDQVLAEVVDYLRRATHKPVVTTEIGQHNATPSVVTGHLRTLVDDFRLPLVVWFDADGMPALGLHDAIGQLRPNGLGFKAFVAAHGDVLR